MNDSDRPNLRVVREDEAPRVEDAQPAAVAPSVSATIPVEPASSEASAFSGAVSVADASRPLSAAYLVCAGCYVADAALDMFHQAASHAPPGTFRRDTPPGLKSAEATRAWLDSHLSAIKKLAESGAAKYDRAVDLKQAVTLAASEIDRAAIVGRVAGLQFNARRDDVLRESRSSLAVPTQTTAIASSDSNLVEVRAEESLYDFGRCALASWAYV